ncbi:MAG: NTP/NDP exchange transporter [Alphaproteobacteria bacterium]|nr:NTP/NDP exchange transporter [Alphaproteobacteria bacterium]
MSKEGSVTPEEFTGWRKILWPIHNFELKKFLPTGLMMLCILFIYTLVRDLKDTLMVSKAVCGGAETLGFLKLYGVTPSAIIFMILFVKLANIFEREKLFYVIVTFFLAFFVTFGFVLYPLRDVLHMSEETIISLQQSIPTLHWVWPVVGNWSFSLFYILAELWGSVVLSALFWQFANEITKVHESKRFYALFGMIGNVGLLASGSVIIFCANLAKQTAAVDASSDTFGTNLFYQMAAVLFFGALLLGIYRWMNKNVLTDPKLYTPGEGTKKKSKPKLGMAESFKYIMTSPYLLMIAVLVLAYGISINLVEAVWKGQLKEFCPDSNDYNAWMGRLSLTTGSVTILSAVAAQNVFRKFSWKVAAMITPIILFVTSALFYGFIMYRNGVGADAQLMGFSVLFLAVLVGFIQNSLSKGTKYTLFDSTKQMAYIPLDPELKVKGQAAVEILAGRGGKSGGAFIQSTLLMIVGGGAKLSSLVDILGTIVMIVVIFWMISVAGLSKKFEALTAEKAAAEKESK